MKSHLLPLTVVLLVASALRADTIVLGDAPPIADVIVVSTSFAFVEYKTITGGKTEAVETWRVRDIVFDKAPRAWRRAQEAYATGDMAGALGYLQALGGAAAKDQSFVREAALLLSLRARLALGEDALAAAVAATLMAEYPRGRFFGDAAVFAARLFAADGKYDEADEIAGHLRAAVADQKPGGDWSEVVDLLIAEILLDRSSPEAAVERSRAVVLRVAAAPDAAARGALLARARLLLGRALLALGEEEKAMRLAAEMAEASADGRGVVQAAAGLLEAEIALAKKSADLAFAILVRIRVEYGAAVPESARACYLLARASEAATGDPAAAARTVAYDRETVRRRPDSREAMIVRARARKN